MRQADKMRMTAMAAISSALIVLVSCTCVAASDIPYEPAQAMDLPFQTPGSLEVRLWNPGMMHPFKLVRVMRSSAGVSGEVYWWDVRTASPESTPKSVRHRSERALTRGLRRNCEEPIQQRGNTLWCRQHFKTTPAWPLILSAIQPERLWPLRSESELGARRCCIEDGESIVIELIEGARYHHVEYSNPNAQCPWTECAVANDVLELLHAKP